MEYDVSFVTIGTINGGGRILPNNTHVSHTLYHEDRTS